MKLYTGNLPFSTGDEELRALFAEHGQVESAVVITDRDTGQSKGFGFVEMSDADARKAMQALNQKEVDGRTIVVNEARPREDRGGPRRNFGGGGGGGGGRNRW